MRGCALAAGLWLAATASAAFAQVPLRVLSEDAAPQGAQAEAVQDLARREGTAGKMTYAREVTTEAEDDLLVPDRDFRLDGGISTALVLALVLGVLVLLIRFGGSGALVQRRPEGSPTATATPDAWNITEVERAGDAGDLLRQIAAMPDRRAALVRLLRHCLLRAADDCGTRFLRADTERAAFRRLPPGWSRHEALGQILRDAELANYGGRPVDEGRFAALLDLGRAILTARGGRRA